MNATTNSVFFSGETESRAVLAAANHFGVSPDQVVFDRVEKRHGFVKRRRVVIRVDPEQVGSEVDGQMEAEEQMEVETPSEPAVEESARGLTPSAPGNATPGVQMEQETAESSVPPEEGEHPDQDSDEILEIAHEAFRQLLELADLEVSAEMVLTGGRLEVEIEGVDQELLTEDEGQVLLALQHLLPRVMYGQLGRIVPCHLDSGGYQRRKEERLRGLARRVADEVASRGGTRTLRPMNPADRRIVHITLADDPEVETESQGSGYFKRVNIRSI
jgi:spoIIIJ-associated protein